LLISRAGLLSPARPAVPFSLQLLTKAAAAHPTICKAWADNAYRNAVIEHARDHGLPLPAPAFVMSPNADLTLAGATMGTKREADPLFSRELLQPRVTDYTSGQDAAVGLISPVFADLSGVPPLIIQAGTHEVLLDDAVRLARQAATADAEVTPDITARVPHVFQAFYPILDQAAAALDRAGQLLSAHLAGPRARTR
jgi:epsilon-lactone hydrolase